MSDIEEQKHDEQEPPEESFVMVEHPSSTVGSHPPCSLGDKPKKWIIGGVSFVSQKLPDGTSRVFTEDEFDRVYKVEHVDKCQYMYDDPSELEAVECNEVEPKSLLEENLKSHDEIETLRSKVIELETEVQQLNRKELDSQLGEGRQTSVARANHTLAWNESKVRQDGTEETTAVEPQAAGGQQSVVALEERVEELEMDLKTKDGSIEILKGLCESLNSEKEQLKNTVSRAFETVNSLDGQLEEEAFAKHKAEAEYVKLKMTTGSLLEDLNKVQSSLAEKEQEYKRLKSESELSFDKTGPANENPVEELEHSSQSSSSYERKLARAEERAREMETHWREEAGKAKGFRRQLDARFAEVLELKDEREDLRLSLQKGVDAEERVKELEDIVKALQGK